MELRRLTREQARRIAIKAQLLDANRPADLVKTVEQLMFLQLDPTAVIAPSADLIAWSRLGAAYDPAHLKRATEVDRTLFEHLAQPSPTEPGIAMLRPMSDLGLYLADMAAWPNRSGSNREWVKVNDAFRKNILDQLQAAGPLMSRDIPDTSVVPWTSSGWTNDRNVTQMLQILVARGEVAITGRRGKQRLWDLAERVYPEVAVVPADEAHRIVAERRLRSLGIARPKIVGQAGEPVEVEDTAGEWRLDPSVTADDFEGRTALLSPFDRLIHNRPRAIDLFDFDYILEMYKPKAQRRWGYFALPVLHGDRLVGKVDATADSKASILHVHAVHHDVRTKRTMTAAIDTELGALADWLRLEKVQVGQPTVGAGN
jgi:uncharacterized protein YcaQ